MTEGHVPSTERDPRFAFGKNWEAFSRTIDEERLESAVDALKELLRVTDLEGTDFLDIGCGSGLSSLAALKLGANVRAFDYDIDSVRTAQNVLANHTTDARRWSIEQGSILDCDFIEAIGTFDVVYSWGVLHHTGDLWRALKIAASRVKPGGKLAIAVYNDQGGASRRWLALKRTYVASPAWLRMLLVFLVGGYIELRSCLIRLIRGQNPLPFKDWQKRKADRGMSVWHDLKDWIGGYPFEVAKPEAIFEFLRVRDFKLEGLTTCAGGHGCNEFLFVRESSSQ